MSEAEGLSANASTALEAAETSESGATSTWLLEFFLLSSRLQGRVAEILEAEGREYDLTATETIALLWLSLGSSTVSGVAKAVGLRPNGASVLVERLRSRRLVRRQRSRRDQRVVTVSLTDAGQSRASALIAGLKSNGAGLLLSRLSATERGWLLSMMQRLTSA